MTIFSPLSTQPVFLGQQLQIGAIIQVYDAGTLTPKTVFKDGLAQVPWAQAAPGQPLPAGALVSDGNGCIPGFWVQGNPYRVRISSAGGVQIRDIDNLPGDIAQGGGGGGGGGTGFSTGDIIGVYTTAIITGRVRLNGKTIGSASSGASELASSTCQAAFIFLWNADTNLAVSGGRGASGLADFNANKTITLPDFNARVPMGIDGMGSTPTGRLSGGTFASGNATTLGSAGGEAAHTLTVPESAAHTHSGTTNSNAGFQMTFTTAATSAGTPSGTISSAGSHNHSGSTGLESANHTHDMSTMGSAGSHSHGGATGLESANLHTITADPVSSVTRTFGNVQGGSLGSFSYVSDVNFTTAQFSVGPDHTHSISVDGSHTHSGSTGNPSQSHTHAISFDGTHSHTFTGSAMATHVHTGSTDLGGIHTHGFTTASTGGGSAHNNLSPFILITFYLVL
jgi:hypothetical protein